MILVKGGHVAFRTEAGPTRELPLSYGMIHDETGAQLDACTLFFGPFVDAGLFDGELPEHVRDYFGNDLKLRVATFDVPSKAWSDCDVVTEILYRRIGRYETDAFHAFDRPQTLQRSRKWYRITLPDDCVVNWRGIVKP